MCVWQCGSGSWQRCFNCSASKWSLASGDLVLNLLIQTREVVVWWGIANAVVLADNDVVLQQSGMFQRAYCDLRCRGDDGRCAQEVGYVRVEEVLVGFELAQPWQTRQVCTIPER